MTLFPVTTSREDGASVFFSKKSLVALEWTTSQNMSILIVFDIEFDGENSTLRLGYVKDTLKQLFLDEEFNREYSECLISVYFVLDEKKSLVFNSTRLKKVSWHPVGNSSSMESLVIIDKLLDQIASNFKKQNLGQGSICIKSEMEEDKTQSSLKPISNCFKEFLNDGVIFEKVGLQMDFDISSKGIPGTNYANWTQEHQNIGRERQLLVIWLIDSSVYLKRLNNGGFPRFQDLSESSLIPNVELKYSLLIYGEDHKGEHIFSESFLSEAQIKSVSLLPLCSADKILKNYICDEINSYFYSEKHVSVFSSDSSKSNLENYNDLSIAEFNLYPSLTKFPLFIQDTLQVLTLPPYSAFIGVISISKYQPLPVLTRRLIELKNSSEGKNMAIQALTLALHKEKFAMALELNHNWFALLVSIVLGNDIHLAMDILPPGYVITT